MHVGNVTHRASLDLSFACQKHNATKEPSGRQVGRPKQRGNGSAFVACISKGGERGGMVLPRVGNAGLWATTKLGTMITKRERGGYDACKGVMILEVPADPLTSASERGPTAVLPRMADKQTVQYHGTRTLPRANLLCVE